MHGGMPVMSDALETSACCSDRTSAMQSGSSSGSPFQACSNASFIWGTGAVASLPQQGPTCCACWAPPLPWSPPAEGSGGSGTVRHDMAGMMVLLQRGGGRAERCRQVSPEVIHAAQCSRAWQCCCC